MMERAAQAVYLIMCDYPISLYLSTTKVMIINYEKFTSLSLVFQRPTYYLTPMYYLTLVNITPHFHEYSANLRNSSVVTNVSCVVALKSVYTHPIV